MTDETEFKIEKGVPIPPGGGRPTAPYPFDKMEVGDSFFTAGEKAQSRISNSAKNYATKKGVKFTTRTVTEGGVKGARIWRIE